MRQIINGGAATILVSHSLSQIKEMCNKVLWLHRGNQIAYGETEPICEFYQRFFDKEITLEKVAEILADKQ